MAPKPVEQGDETFPDNIEDATCPDPKVTSYRDTTDPDGKNKPTVAGPIAAGASQDLAVVTKMEVEHSNATGEPVSPEEIFVRSLDKYEFLDKIGQGGMGKVFRVRHRELNRVEAIKVLNIFGLDQEQVNYYVTRFRREVQAILELKNTRRDILIPLVYDFEQRQCFFYYTMDFIPGRSLKQVVETQRPSSKRAVEIVRELCEILELIHQKGIIHRDIKPANIIVDEAGKAWLVDFGLVKGIQEDSKSDITQGRSMGTPRYMAPEQIEREQGKEIDARCDIYALGAVLYEVLTEKYAVAGGTQNEIFFNIFYKEPASFAELGIPQDSVVEAICRKAMNKQPEDRYQSAGEFKNALQAWEQRAHQTGNEERIPLDKEPADSRMTSRPRTKKLIWLGLALAVLLGFALWMSKTEKTGINASWLSRPEAAPKKPSPKAQPSHAMTRKANKVVDVKSDPQATAAREKLRTAIKIGIMKMDKISYTWSAVDAMKEKDFYKIRLQVFQKVWVYGFQQDSAGHFQMLFPRQDPPGGYDYAFSNPMMEGVYQIPPQDGIFELTQKPNKIKDARETFYFLWSASPFANPQQEIQAILYGKPSRGCFLEKKIAIK